MTNEHGWDLEELTEYFQYLNDLRESGETNMYGAAPYLERDWSLTRKEARAVLTGWMAAFGRDKTAEQMAAEHLAKEVS